MQGYEFKILEEILKNLNEIRHYVPLSLQNEYYHPFYKLIYFIYFIINK